jgi:hypothetical protein
VGRITCGGYRQEWRAPLVVEHDGCIDSLGCSGVAGAVTGLMISIINRHKKFCGGRQCSEAAGRHQSQRHRRVDAD